jgi:hypothetical protein
MTNRSRRRHRADSDGRPRTCRLPPNKARPAQGHPTGPRCLSPDSWWLREECCCGRSPGPAEHEVVQDVHGVLAVLAGGVDVASDVEPVLGDVVAGQAAGDFLLGLEGAHAALADVVRRPGARVRGEPRSVRNLKSFSTDRTVLLASASHLRPAQARVQSPFGYRPARPAGNPGVATRFTYDAAPTRTARSHAELPMDRGCHDDHVHQAIMGRPAGLSCWPRGTFH